MLVIGSSKGCRNTLGGCCPDNDRYGNRSCDIVFVVGACGGVRDAGRCRSLGNIDWICRRREGMDVISTGYGSRDSLLGGVPDGNRAGSDSCRDAVLVIGAPQGRGGSLRGSCSNDDGHRRCSQDVVFVVGACGSGRGTGRRGGLGDVNWICWGREGMDVISTGHGSRDSLLGGVPDGNRAGSDSCRDAVLVIGTYIGSCDSI